MIKKPTANMIALRRMIERAALEHACPRCLCLVGERCVVRSRGVPVEVSERAKAHAARIAVAFDAGTVRITETR